MTALILAALLTTASWPLNPVKQDTAAFLNLHVNAGITAPNGVAAIGGDASAKLEMLITHPFVIRAGMDYRAGSVMIRRLPDGLVHGPTWSIEAMYYRGTNRMVGYIAAGPVFATNMFRLDGHAADSLAKSHSIESLGLKPTIGGRLTFGLRYRKAMSIEVSITALQPEFVYTERHGPNRWTEFTQKERFNDFRVSFGYVFELMRFNRRF